MASRHQHRRWSGVLLASLALHGLLLWWWSLEVPVPAAPVGSRPLVWVDVEPEVQSQPANPAPPQVRRRLATPAAATGPTAASPRPATEASAEATGAAPALGDRGDMPLARRPNLDPGLGAVLRMAPAADAEAPHGTTVRNGPGEEEDPGVALEVQGEQLTRELNVRLLEEVGRVAIGVGTVPGHFRRAQSTLRELFQRSRVDVTEASAGDVARDVAKVMLPGGISPEASRRVTDTPLGYSVANQTVNVPGPDDMRFREQAMSLMAATEEAKKRLAEPRLRTILELITDPYGVVANAIVLERSGDRRFDESVLHLSRKAFRSLPDDDEKALGSSWWKTRWQITWAPPNLPGARADVRVTLLDAHRIPPVQ